MKKSTKRKGGIIFCVLAVSALFFASAALPGQPKMAVPLPELKRYEDKSIGFSIGYDAKILTEDLGPVGPFVFRREAADGNPTAGITAGPYPPGIALEDTANLISDSLPRMIPGCLIQKVSNQQLIKLTDGSRANYFEIEMKIGGMEYIAAFVTASKSDRLIVFGASDSKGGSVANLTAMVKSLRLDVEVDETALRARGFAKDGKFVRTDSPAFVLEYPKEFQNRVLESNQIFRAGIPQGSPSMAITISSLSLGGDIPEQLKMFAEAYANGLKGVGTDIKIISQNPIKTYKNFDAYEIQIVWRWRQQVTLTTVVHLIAKENKAIQLAGHTVYGIEELTDIFQTINLNP
jgi:hypothetical protein